MCQLSVFHPIIGVVIGEVALVVGTVLVAVLGDVEIVVMGTNNE